MWVDTDSDHQFSTRVIFDSRGQFMSSIQGLGWHIKMCMLLVNKSTEHPHPLKSNYLAKTVNSK